MSKFQVIGAKLFVYTCIFRYTYTLLSVQIFKVFFTKSLFSKSVPTSVYFQNHWAPTFWSFNHISEKKKLECIAGMLFINLSVFFILQQQISRFFSKKKHFAWLTKLELIHLDNPRFSGKIDLIGEHRMELSLLNQWFVFLIFCWSNWS